MTAKNPQLVDKVVISGATGSGIFLADGTSIIDENGNIDAPITTTDITGTSLNLSSSTQVTSILDEDNMASDSATALATQQSIKAYVDASGGGVSETDLTGGTGAANMVSTDAGATGVVMTVEHDSASPASFDKVFRLVGQGKDDGGADADYASLEFILASPTAGSESGAASIFVAQSSDGNLYSTFTVNEDSSRAAVVIGDILGGGGLSDGMITAGGSNGNLYLNHKGTGDIVVEQGNASNVFRVYSSLTGAQGVVEEKYHESSTPAASDILYQVNIAGEDSADNKETYITQNYNLVDPTSGGELASITWDFVDGAGSTKSSAFAFSYNGAASVLNANATLQIGDGVSGNNIKLQGGAGGAVQVVGDAPSLNSAVTQIKETIRYEFDSTDFDVNDDIFIFNGDAYQCTICDVRVIVDTPEGGALTGTLHPAGSGAGAAITDSFDLNSTSGSLLRTSTLSGYDVVNSGTLAFHASANPGTVIGVLEIDIMRHE